MSDGGKGSAPRKQQDQEAYKRNYEQIFGKKKTQDEAILELAAETREQFYKDVGDILEPRA